MRGINLPKKKRWGRGERKRKVWESMSIDTVITSKGRRDINSE